MTCLDNIVAIRGICEPETPDSIYFINDLPAISVKEISASLNSESASAVELIRQKIELAGDLITSRVQTFLQPRFKGGSIISNGTVGYYQDDLDSIDSAAGYLIGKQIEIWQGEYLEFFLSRVGLQMASTGAVSVLVYDLIQNKLLDTISVSAVAGEITYVDVYKSYKTNGQKLNLFIGYAYANGYNTILSRNNCTSCTGQVYSNPYIKFSNRRILSGSNKINENLESGSEDSLTLQYAVNCTSDNFICSIKHLLAAAIWWKAGELLATEMRFSKRLNSVINFYSDDHDKLIASYSAAAEAEISNILQNMRIPDNMCFTCNKRAKLEVRI